MYFKAGAINRAACLFSSPPSDTVSIIEMQFFATYYLIIFVFRFWMERGTSYIYNIMMFIFFQLTSWNLYTIFNILLFKHDFFTVHIALYLYILASIFSHIYRPIGTLKWNHDIIWGRCQMFRDSSEKS